MIPDIKDEKFDTTKMRRSIGRDGERDLRDGPDLVIVFEMMKGVT